MHEQNRLAVIAIIVEEPEASAAVNAVLHEMRDWIVGRMGLPMRERDMSVISITLEAPVSAVNALTGKLGMIQGVSAKALFSKH